MPFVFSVALAIVAAIASAAVLYPVTRWAHRRGVLDVPGEKRRVHDRPIPNIGGLGILFGCGVAGLFFLLLEGGALIASFMLWAGVGGGLLIALAGLYDDTRGLGFKQKFFVQVVVAYALLHAGFRFEVAGLPFVSGEVYDQALLSIPLTMLWIVGVINAVNLIDGIDGLAGGVSAIALTMLAVLFGLTGQPLLAAFALIVAGATVGFLYHNRHPATIFMGDTGSLLLGYILALLPMAGSFHGDPLLALVIPGLVLGVPILDTALTIARRTIRRRAICAPDGEHIHHRLVRRHDTNSVPRAAWTLYGVGAWFGLTAILVSLLPAVWGYVLLAATALMALAWVHHLGYFRVALRARRIRRLQTTRADHPAANGFSVVPSSADTDRGDGAVQDLEHTEVRSSWPHS